MIDRRAYLLDVTDRTPNSRLFEELVDILARFGYNEFYLYRKLPPEEFPSKLAAYCEMQGIKARAIGPDDYERLSLEKSNVMVSTFAARSLAGRIEELRAAMSAAELAVRSRKAKRLLVTDFSDGYAWAPLCVSLPGIVLGGNVMTAGAAAAKMDLEKDLCSVMDFPLGGLLQKLGTLYLRGGAVRADASEYFNILASDHGYSRHPGITQFVLDEIAAIARGVKLQLERWTDRNDWAKEIAYVASLLEAAAQRRNEGVLRALRDEHGRLWRLRNEPEGRVESLSKLPRF